MSTRKPSQGVSRPVSRAKGTGKVFRPTLTLSAPYTGATHRLTVTGTPRSGKNSGQHGTTWDGRPIRRKSEAAAAWLANAVQQIALQVRTVPMIRGRCRIELHVVHAIELTGWDVDNVANLTLDALKKALVIADDCAAIAREIELSADVDKTAPRVEITVRPCMHRYDQHGRRL